MASVNQVNLVGRVGKDPDISYTQDGKARAIFSVATSEKYKGKEVTQWHSVVSFNRTAEIIGQWVKKGDLVWVGGKIEYVKRDGRVYTNIVGLQLQMLGGSKGSEPTEPPADYEKVKSGESEDLPF